MRLFKTAGIIIKRRNFGEADRLITMLTPDRGKIRLLAKGVRKITSRRSGHLEVFGKAECSLYQGKTFLLLTEINRIEDFSAIRTNLLAISYAYYLCELIDVLVPEEQEQVEVYNLLDAALQALSTATHEAEYDQILSDTALSLLRSLGFLPDHGQIPGGLHDFVESLTERKLKTPDFIHKIQINVDQRT